MIIHGASITSPRCCIRLSVFGVDQCDLPGIRRIVKWIQSRKT